MTPGAFVHREGRQTMPHRRAPPPRPSGSPLSQQARCRRQVCIWRRHRPRQASHGRGSTPCCSRVCTCHGMGTRHGKAHPLCKCASRVGRSSNSRSRRGSLLMNSRCCLGSQRRCKVFSTHHGQGGRPCCSRPISPCCDRLRALSLSLIQPLLRSHLGRSGRGPGTPKVHRRPHSWVWRQLRLITGHAVRPSGRPIAIPVPGLPG